MILESIRSHKYAKYSNYLLIAGAVLALAVASYLGYRWYDGQREARAHQDLTESINETLKAIGSSDPATWKDIQQGLAHRAQEHAGTRLEPYYLAFEADALIAQDKLSDALLLMNSVMQKLPAKSPLYPLYGIKRALMKKDLGTPELTKEALAELEEIASSGVPGSNLAFYHLGMIAYDEGKLQDAKKWWDEVKKTSEKDSVLLQLIASKMQGAA